MKKWDIITESLPSRQAGKILNPKSKIEDIVSLLLKNRGLTTKKEIEDFLHPPEPFLLTPTAVDIDEGPLRKALRRISDAIDKKESIVVYADYDADGITAGAIMWETIYQLGGHVMPYIPHRVEEGYGLSIKGLDAVAAQYDPTLIITVDHGITAKDKVAYAKKLGIDVIVTDHHVKPDALPVCTIVHTTKLSGSGVSWFVAKELIKKRKGKKAKEEGDEILALAAIGTIADMVPLVGPNRTVAKYGLAAMNKSTRVGLTALIEEAGLQKGTLGTYDVSHVLAPRLNAMGRIEHALDALRLLCTKRPDKARDLAQKLNLTNKERQQMTELSAIHAKDIARGISKKKLLFIAHESYNQGIIGLVAGKLVEEFYRPAIVIAKGETISKASARSIAGFNIIEAIRKSSDILVDAGGHPMAAGFTIETKYLALLEERLVVLAEKELTDDALIRLLRIDTEIPLEGVNSELWQALRAFAPYGFGNPEPVFVTRDVRTADVRLVGADGKHLKLRLQQPMSAVAIDAIAFGMGELYGKLHPDVQVDIAYTIDMNQWNGKRSLQLKIKDIHVVS